MFDEKAALGKGAFGGAAGIQPHRRQLDVGNHTRGGSALEITFCWFCCHHRATIWHGAFDALFMAPAFLDLDRRLGRDLLGGVSACSRFRYRKALVHCLN